MPVPRPKKQPCAVKIAQKRADPFDEFRAGIVGMAFVHAAGSVASPGSAVLRCKSLYLGCDPRTLCTPTGASVEGAPVRPFRQRAGQRRPR
jgi:hypothetical protein